ncbi:MAG: hypothetical protein AAB865_02665 [Patescibacteria group bacterium]
MTRTLLTVRDSLSGFPPPIDHEEEFRVLTALHNESEAISLAIEEAFGSRRQIERIIFAVALGLAFFLVTSSLALA